MAIRHSTAADSSFSPQGKAAWEAGHTGDASDLSFTPSGIGAVSRTVQDKERDWVSVKDFGAVGDGSTDDSSAILAAVNAATGATGGNSSTYGVYFPAGIYKVTTSACFTPTVASTARGIHFFGAGWYTSIIRYGTLSGATWLYDNGATARTQFSTFEDLGFEGMNPASFSAYTDIPSNAKGFKITSANHEQGFRFSRCRFGYFDTVFDMEGTNTASEMKFFGCKIHHVRSTVYLINNGQSFDHELFGCDIEIVYGDVFSIGANGGGAIKMYGGSVILFSDTGVANYFFKNSGSAGSAAYPFTFDGLRFEFRGNTSNLLSNTTLKTVVLNFKGCLFEDQATVDKTGWVSIGSQSLLKFDDCQFYETVADHIKFVVANSGSILGIAGEIIFEHCALPIDFSDKCSMNNNFGTGLISARNCFGTNVGAPASGAHYAHDFDLHWNEATFGQYGGWASSGATIKDSGSASHPQWRLKTAQIKLVSEFWPAANPDHTLKMPKNAIVKSIYLRKPAGSADATATTFRVSNNDKTTHHLTSNNAAFNLTHTQDVEKYFYHLGTTTNERTLRLNSSAVTTGAIQGGMVIVEYY